jgi:hypothetical protein
MGSFLQKLLTNPEDFKFYTGNQKGAVSPNNQNPRTIPFGRDRFNDGLGDGSNQPYGWKKKPGDIGIGVMIDDYANSYEDTIGEANIDDFIIRGGVLAPLKAVRDSIRLTRFFSDIKNPKGILFLAKQNLLSRIGTKTEASKGLGYAGGALNEGVYTPLSTIGQALVGFAGTHLNKQGLDPTGLFPGASINKYQEVISENQLILPDDFINNRLINLIPKPLNTNPFQSTGILVSLLKGYSVNPPYDPSTLIEYGGGPGSVLGIGKTKIRFATTNDSFSKLTVFDKKNDINSFVKNAFSPLTIDGTSPLAINLNRLVNLSKKEPITGDISYFPKFTFGKNQYESDILLEYKGGPGSKDKVDGTTKINYATDNSGFKSTVFNADVYKIGSFETGFGFKSQTTNLNRLFRLTNSTSSSDILLEYKGGPGSNGKVNGSTKIKYATSNEGFKLTVFDNKNNINSFETGSGLTPQLIDSNRLFRLTNPTSFSDILLEYKGGPGSNGKVDGTTKIKYAINNSGFKLTVFDDYYSSNLLNANGARYKTWDYSKISSQTLNLDADTKSDFRYTLDPKEAPSFLSSSPNYLTKNIEDNLNLRNPGSRGRNRSSYTKGSDGGKALDKLNASPIYESETFIEGQSINNSQENQYKDIIPFIISILNNENTSGGPPKKNMHFRAFIDSFSDSYDANWSPIEYMGRAEKLYKYKGFGRKISMAFTVVAQSREEITAMYDKLNFLASSLAPEYLPSGYMAGNIAYITLGEYIYDQPGIINSLTFDIPEESPWEIGIDDTGKRLDVKDVRQVPHMIKVTGFNFTPIHKFRPEKQTFDNDKLGTASTRLLGTGKQKYIDQLRPKSTNYDKEVQEDLSLIIPTTQQDILVT